MYQTPRSLFAAKFLGETNLIEGSVVETTPAGTVVATVTRAIARQRGDTGRGRNPASFFAAAGCRAAR